MKKVILLAALAAASLGFTSCCSMFGGPSLGTAGHHTETRQVKTCRTDTITEQVLVSSSPKGGNVYETVERKVPRYKTVTRRVRTSCGPCTRFYCPRKGCCGSNSDSMHKMITAQPGAGSPFIGLSMTMKPLAE